MKSFHDTLWHILPHLRVRYFLTISQHHSRLSAQDGLLGQLLSTASVLTLCTNRVGCSGIFSHLVHKSLKHKGVLFQLVYTVRVCCVESSLNKFLVWGLHARTECTPPRSGDSLLFGCWIFWLALTHSQQHGPTGHTDYPWANKMLAWNGCLTPKYYQKF